MTELALNVLARLADLLRRKQDQYATTDDLANFRKTASLLGHVPDERGCYEAAKAMMAKHVAHIYNNDIGGCKIIESLKDIAVYSVIMIVMRERWEGASRR